MSVVRLGLIGLGGMGTFHSGYLLEGKIRRCEVTAVCDIDPDRLRPFDAHAGIRQFGDSRALLRSGLVDAVLIVTPHYSHTTIGIDALQLGLHVLVEKPISVHKADCERLIAAYRPGRQVFGAMFNQRSLPYYQKAKQLIAAGELGKITRVNWIITDWFRTDAYYASSGWRATWAGEGGGVLLNQCPHNLDLLQHLCGMPSLVHGHCGLGKFHKIEVEDEVTAYFEYPDGATGVFITTTGEAPGTNRLEISGDRGRLVLEGGQIRFTRNEVAAAAFCRTAPGLFDAPDVWNVEIPVRSGGGHSAITQNFVDAILDGTPLIAPAPEGIRSVELGNAILYSSCTGKPVQMPLDGRKYERLLKRLIAESKVRPKGPADLRRKAAPTSMANSF